MCRAYCGDAVRTGLAGMGDQWTVSVRREGGTLGREMWFFLLFLQPWAPFGCVRVDFP